MSPSERSNTAIAFALGSIVTLGISYIVSGWTSNRRNQQHASASSSASSDKSSLQLPQELRDEQLSRHTLYFGPDGMAKLAHSKVLVVGLGGVGSHTAHMLARSGVGCLRLVDFDQVSLSSLNRHACATLADVGTPKATCLVKFLRRICPDPQHLILESRVEMYTPETAESLLAGRDWDIVVDAIDDVPTKAALLAECVKRKIRVISCMGAGGKSDVTRLHISDLKTASRDALASKLRQSLKKLLKGEADGRLLSCLEDPQQLSIVFSSERTVMKLADFTEEQKEEGVHQFGAVDGMRIRVLPVLGTMPAIMGMALAAYCVTELADKPFLPTNCERLGRNVRNRIWQHLRRREVDLQKELCTKFEVESDESGQVLPDRTWVGLPQIDQDDTEYLVELWRNRCAVTGERMGTVLELIRWDPTKPCVCQNLVVMNKTTVEKYDMPYGKERIPVEIREQIEKRMATCRIDAYHY